MGNIQERTYEMIAMYKETYGLQVCRSRSCKSSSFQALKMHMENVRWRNDPLRLKERFLEPISVFVAEQLRAIANRLNP